MAQRRRFRSHASGLGAASFVCVLPALVTGCVTRIEGVVSDAGCPDGACVEYSLVPNPTTGSPLDLGGTLAFQFDGGAKSVNDLVITTSLPHSELDLFYQDPQRVFNTINATQDWSTLTASQKTIAALVVPALPVNQTVNDTDILAASVFSNPHPGIWRMDHGACSIQIPYKEILDGIASGLVTTDNSGYQTGFGRFEGLSFLTHPETSAPAVDNHGGIIFQVFGTATDDGNSFFSDISFGEVPLATVNFSATEALDFSVNGSGVLQATVLSETSSSSCAQTTGLASVCESGSVQSGIDSAFTGTLVKTLNAKLAMAFVQPIPHNLIDVGLAAAGEIPAVCPVYQSCSAATDCVGKLPDGSASDGLTLYNLLTLIGGDASVTLGATATGLGLTGSITSGNTVVGLSSQVKGQAEAALENAANWQCATASSTGVPGSMGTPTVGPDGGACGAPEGKVCQLVLGATRVNTYADSMEIVWYDEYSKLEANASILTSLALGEVSGTPGPFCNALPNDGEFGRAGVDVSPVPGN
jgi:hypothetical protein